MGSCGLQLFFFLLLVFARCGCELDNGFAAGEGVTVFCVMLFPMANASPNDDVKSLLTVVDGCFA